MTHYELLQEQVNNVCMHVGARISPSILSISNMVSNGMSDEVIVATWSEMALLNIGEINFEEAYWIDDNDHMKEIYYGTY